MQIFPFFPKNGHNQSRPNKPLYKFQNTRGSYNNLYHIYKNMVSWELWIEVNKLLDKKPISAPQAMQTLQVDDIFHGFNNK